MNSSQFKSSRNTTAQGAADDKIPKFQLYRWFFTLSAKVEPVEPEKSGSGILKGGSINGGVLRALALEARSLNNIFQTIAKEWYFQLEKGENGYIHFQGCFSLKDKEYFSSVKNLLGRDDVHLEPIKNWNASKNYTTKNFTRLLGPWNNKSVWIDTIQDLYPWQDELVNLLKVPCTDNRTIYWYYDRTGCNGKTSLCKYLYVHLGACIFNNGKFNDLAHALPEAPEIVCFNLPRCLEKKVNYSAIEAIKDGLIFSGKYDSRTKVFNSPHVVIMANFPPDYKALSLDRWKVVDLAANGELEGEPSTTLDGIEEVIL